MERFTDQVAVVTGASSGIGRALALALATEGARLVLVGRRREALADVVRQVRTLGGHARAVEADLGSDDLPTMARRLERELATADMLIHSAGSIVLGGVGATPVDALDEQYRVNLRAPYVLTQALLSLLAESRGQIVFVNSSAVFNPRASVAAYCATKAALQALADSLRDEVNSLGIRVLSVYPGRTASPMQAAICGAEGREYRPERLLQPEDIAASVVAALALPRTAEVTDIRVRPMLKS